MILVHGLTFQDVLIATKIWYLNSVSNIYTNESKPFIKIENGNIEPPRVGNLIIYKRGNGVPWGHVAVITEVNLSNGFIRVAEQNESDKFWTGDYSREVSLEYKDNKYWIRDIYKLYGWMAYDNISHLSLLDPKI